MKDDIVRAVDSLTRDIENCKYDAQITVADNSKNQDYLNEALKKYPQVKYVDCGGNVGFGKGNNIGFKATPARYYFALNRDTVILENSRTIERIIDVFPSHQQQQDQLLLLLQSLRLQLH